MPKTKASAKSRNSGTRKKAEAKAARAEAKERREKQKVFLDSFRELGTVSAACIAAGIGRTTAYRWRQADEDFALAWHDLEEDTTDEMEREAYRRAVEGVPEPVFHKGEEIATINRYSDTLLIFMLKARKPETYRERFDVNHSGKVATPERPDLSKLDLEEAEQLTRLLAKARSDARQAEV
jgi:hypothetical protein